MLRRHAYSSFLALTAGLAVAMLIPRVLKAQEITGTISGTVRDATGAVIPEATVLATQVETTQSEEVRSLTRCASPRHPDDGSITLLRERITTWVLIEILN